MKIEYILLGSLALNGFFAIITAGLFFKLKELVENQRASKDRVDEGGNPAPHPVRETQVFEPPTPVRSHTVATPRRGLLSGLKVLLVDDTPLNIDVLTEFLEILGLEQYYLATDGEEALEIFKKAPVGLIYMDIQMPKMNGIEATKAIRATKNGKFVPIVGVTAFSRVVNEDMCRQAGMTGFMQKPVELSILERQTKLALASARKR